MNDVEKIRTKVNTMKAEGKTEAEIAEALGLSASTLRVKLGREIRLEAEALEKQGKSNIEIAEALGINESRVQALLDPSVQRTHLETGKKARAMKDEGFSNADIAKELGVEEIVIRTVFEELGQEISDETVIWTLGEYKGREGAYAQFAGDISRQELVFLVQRRVKEDGKWAIENAKVAGENERIFRRMMEWVSEPKNIEQCYNSNLDIGPTVDWICRNLAQASQRIAGGLNRD